MSSAAFDRIARNYEANRKTILELERYLSRRGIGIAIRPNVVADFISANPHLTGSLLDELVKEEILDQLECWICPNCDELIETEADEYGRRDCDLCSRVYSTEQVNLERCYFLKRPVIRTLSSSSDRSDQTIMNDNPLKDIASQKWARITPWATLAEDEYTLSFSTLSAGVKRAALQLLQKYGIVRLRWEADTPSSERLLTLENWVGPARLEQNDFTGKVKALKPDYDAPPITGDSALALAPHVDGTQDVFTPAVLAFQYVYGGTWGGESTFLDTAAMFSELASDELEHIVTALARNDCATCTKTKIDKKTGIVWTKTFKGPLFRSEYGGHAISIRVREDDLLKVIPECQQEFDALKSVITNWSETNLLRYTPHEGDVVIFDNRRILHGRAAIGGRHQRIHDRMWIDRLLREHEGNYLLGIRPISAGLVDAVQRANRG